MPATIAKTNDAGSMQSDRSLIKRRRVWFRIHPVNPVGQSAPSDRTVVEIGGLARTDQAGYGEEFGGLAALADRPPTKR